MIHVFYFNMFIGGLKFPHKIPPPPCLCLFFQLLLQMELISIGKTIRFAPLRTILLWLLHKYSLSFKESLLSHLFTQYYVGKVSGLPDTSFNQIRWPYFKQLIYKNDWILTQNQPNQNSLNESHFVKVCKMFHMLTDGIC